MNKYIITFFLAFLFRSGFSQTNNVIYSNYIKALDILNLSIQHHGGIVKIKKNIQFTVKGTMNELGHLPLPEQRSEYNIVAKYAFIHSKDILYEYDTLTDTHDTYKAASVFNRDSVFYIGFADDTINAAGNITSNKMKNILWQNLPTTIMLEAYQQKATLYYMGNENSNGKVYDIISFNSIDGKKYAVYTDAKNHEFFKITELTYDDIYGDNFTSVEFYNYKFYNNLLLPINRIDKEYAALKMKLTYSNYEFDDNIDTSIYQICKTCEVNNNTEKVANISVDTITPNLFLLELHDVNNKVLVSNFNTYISVFEAPGGIELTNSIINKIKKLIPNKPIKYVFVSHHHPDHAGGIRQYARNGTIIVTTPSNKNYFNKIINTRHTLGNDFNSSPIVPKYIFIDSNNNKIFKDETNEVVAYNVADATGHTKEYVIFYFPKQKIILAGDLLYLPLSNKKYISTRTQAILNLINSKKLLVDKIYTSWPLKGQKEFGTLGDLK